MITIKHSIKKPTNPLVRQTGSMLKAPLGSTISWTDKILSDNSLIRTYENTVYEIVDGEVVLIKENFNSKPNLPLILPNKRRINNNFLSMDIETVMVPPLSPPVQDDNINDTQNINNLRMYLICLFDGKYSYSFFNNKLTEESSLNLVRDLVKIFNSRKFKGTKVYIHNFGKFDSYFLLKHLVKLGNCGVLLHDGNLLTLSFISNKMKPKCPIIFKDSFKLLPSSLKKLSASFKVEKPKSLFPILFNDVNYKGSVPKIEYFKDITIDNYNEYLKVWLNKEWNFKKEAISYCKLDCISLYQVLFNFNRLIFDKIKINISKYPTIPSLAFAIYRTQIFNKEIHSLTGSTYNNIALGYTGVATQV
jgi:hypothetical protein